MLGGLENLELSIGWYLILSMNFKLLSLGRANEAITDDSLLSLAHGLSNLKGLSNLLLKMDMYINFA